MRPINAVILSKFPQIDHLLKFYSDYFLQTGNNKSPIEANRCRPDKINGQNGF